METDGNNYFIATAVTKMLFNVLPGEAKCILKVNSFLAGMSQRTKVQESKKIKRTQLARYSLLYQRGSCRGEG